MKFKKVLLAVLIPYKLGYTKSIALRAGLGYIAEALYEGGINYKVFDIGIGYKFSDFIDMIKNFKPQLVGISMSTYRYLDTYRMISKVKQKFKDIKIVVGGPHATTFKMRILKECPAIDFVIVGEGEYTLLELCRGENLKDIPGLIYRKNGNIVFTGERQQIENLDIIHYPKYHNFELENYPLKNSPVTERIIPIVSSRGCPFNCIYCPVGTVIGRKFRKRTAQNVMDELNFWYSKGYRKFSFIDDNFTLDRQRVWQICEEIKKCSMKDLIMSCPNGIRADKTDKDLLKFMYDVGFKYIGFGVEVGNDRILHSIRKAQEIKDVEEAIRNACEIGYYVDLYFLVGTPEETENDIYDSIRLAAKYPVDNVYFFNVIPYPETYIYRWIEERRYFVYSPDYYLNKIHSYMNKPVFYTPALPVQKRKELLKFTKRVAKNLKLKKYIEKFTKLGISFQIAKIISKIYASEPVQVLFNDIKLFRQAKAILLKLI